MAIQYTQTWMFASNCLPVTELLHMQSLLGAFSLTRSQLCRDNMAIANIVLNQAAKKPHLWLQHNPYAPTLDLNP